MRVLIVDPDVELARLLKVGLQFGFYAKAKRLARARQRLAESLDVEQVADPAAALSILAAATAATRVDLIFVDLPLGRAQDHAFLRACQRQRDRYGEIIVITDASHEAEVGPALAAGATGHLLKPFRPEQVVEHVFEAWREPNA
jgi:CheY-like chemotaxis protein